MKLAIIAYVPPPTRGHPQVFVENLRKFKTTYPLVLYSDHDYPDTVRLKGSPESFKDAKLPNGEPNKFACHNAVFFTGLRVARSQGYTHILYMEDDCRVGCDHWDAKIVIEAFSKPAPWIVAGSAAVYNPSNAGIEAHRRWEQLVKENSRKNYPIPTYGWVGAAVKHPSCVFVNGAIGIYSMPWMESLFDLEKTGEVAGMNTAFDMAIGIKIWERFGAKSYDVVAHLSSLYSSYGDVLTSESERAELLKSGAVCAVHQIKSNWTV